MKKQLSLYNLLIIPAMVVLGAASLFNGKILRTLRARKKIREKWSEKLKTIDRKGKLVWFHVSSAGEFLQARPLIDLLTERYGSSIQVALTFFSPSGFEYYNDHDRADKNSSVVFMEYLPFDTRRNAVFCLDSLRPDLIVYIRYDLWPNLVSEASSRSIPQVLLSADLSDRPGNVKGIRAWFMKGLLSSLTAIGAVSERAASRLRALVTEGPGIEATGDIRFDQVIKRIENSKVDIPESILGDRRTFIIAGSTWQADEKIVIPAFRKILDRFKDSGLIIAPHETASARIGEIEDLLTEEGLTSVTMSRLESHREDVGSADVIIADGVGYLAELYRAGEIAYVGGSWTTGVHNIMEPSVFGLPVFFGPRTSNAWEADELVSLGSAFTVKSPEDLAAGVCGLLADRRLLEEKGERSKRFIIENSGAAQISLDLISRFIGDSPASR